MRKSLAVVLPGLLLPIVWILTAPAADPKPAAPTNLEALNTRADEDDPFVTSSGMTLYYSSNARGKYGIYFSTHTRATQPWPAGKVLDDVASEVDDRGAYLTAETTYPQYLFFATQYDKEQKNFDIYAAVKQRAGADFTTMTPVLAVCTAEDEMHPWITNSGKELYFSRKTKEGWRVFVTKRANATGPQGWAEPKAIKELPEGFHHATLTPDGKTMYLQGPLEKDRWGLFRSTLSGTTWSKPEPLETLNNAEGPKGDVSPSLSRDGSVLYFASDRPGGKGGMDLYRIAVREIGKK